MLEELTHLTSTIEELLFLSQAESHGITLQLTPCEPEALLANFNIDAQVLAEHHGVVFSCTHEGTGAALCEPRWIRRVLLNLLSNAISASPPGGLIRLRSQLVDQLWRVQVEDQGCGVPPSEHEHIFDRFVRLQVGPGIEQEGSGLGLAICRGIVELHHGRIYAEAGPEGLGLRVVFEVPARSRGTRETHLSPGAREPSALASG